MGRQLLWSSTLSNNLRLIHENNMTQTGSVSLLAFQDRLESNFYNPVTTFDLGSVYLELMTNHLKISEAYLSTYNGNICERSDLTSYMTSRCKDELAGRLEGGISSVFAYYAVLDRSLYHEIEETQYLFIDQQLLSLLDEWKEIFEEGIKSATNAITLGLVLYVTLSLIGFMVIWGAYLNSLNLRLNQTTQMLNMIPMKMMPKGRKDIRDFFSWIIREANKNKQEK